MLGGLSVAPLHAASTSEVAGRRHALALLALTAVGGENGISSERAMALLWPEADDAHARNNFKQLIFAIRHGLSLDIVDRCGPTLRIDFSVMSADVVDFERAMAAGNLERGVELYSGPFLDGFHMPHVAEFVRWVDGQRTRLARRYEEALETLACRAGAASDLRGAIHWWRALTEHDPVNSEYAIGLMDALGEVGEPIAALRHFADYARAVRDEFEIDPDPSVRLAAERVKQRLAHRWTAFSVDRMTDVSRGSPPPRFIEPQKVARSRRRSIVPPQLLSDSAADD
jgi:DNA-binding SARP family transcriptional activator